MVSLYQDKNGAYFDDWFYNFLNNRKNVKRIINKKNIEDFVNYTYMQYLYVRTENEDKIIELNSRDILDFVRCKDFLSNELSSEFKNIYKNTESIELKLYILGQMLKYMAYSYAEEIKNQNTINIMKNIIEKIEDVEKELQNEQR
jgi:hypothetical protein